jgi:hypothetical protein
MRLPHRAEGWTIRTITAIAIAVMVANALRGELEAQLNSFGSM